MAEITKSGLPSLCSQLPPHSHRIPFDGITDEVNCLGEDVVAGDICCVHSDGLVYKTDATGDAPVADAAYHGMAAQSLSEGEPISLIWGERFSYAADLTPGEFLYPSGTVAGGLANTRAYDGQMPVAFAINETDIQLLPPNSGLDAYNQAASAVAIEALVALTDSTGGTANNTLVAIPATTPADLAAQGVINGNIRDNIADLAAKVNAIIAALKA